MTALQIAIAAIRGCHLKGIILIPFLFITAIDAVNKNRQRVRIPRYIITGFPKIKK
jgi:hypothetical protein